MAKQIINTGATRNLWDKGSIKIPWEPNEPINVNNISGLASALSNASWGDTIVIAPGEYNVTAALVPTAPFVTVMGATTNRSDVILRGPGMDNTNYGAAANCFWTAQAGFSLRNLTIDGFYWHGLTFGNGAIRPYLDNVAILNCGEQFIKVSNLTTSVVGGYVRRSRFGFTGDRPMVPHGSSMFYGGFIDAHRVAGWVIEDSDFEEITPTEDEISWAATNYPGATPYLWSPAIYFWNRSRNNIVRRCRFKNCGRSVAYGLSQQTSGDPDNTGGAIINNIAYMDSGRIGAAQIANSDGMILAWDSPDTLIAHNTILTRGMINNSVQTRWGTAGTLVTRNLTDTNILQRDAANATLELNRISVSSALFIDEPNNNLLLSEYGSSVVEQDPRLSQVLDDINGSIRPANTYRGAHHYGI